MLLEKTPERVRTALALAASTALAPLIVAAAAEVSRRTCVNAMSVRNDGSWYAIADLLTGAVDATFCDIDFDDSQTELISYPVVAFTLAFIANPSACVPGLSTAQLRDILTGRVYNWAQVGGADCPVRLINRNEASGVRSIVEQLALRNRSIVNGDRTVDSNRVAALQVQKTHGAFSYVALPGVRDLDIAHVAIDDVPPRNKNVLAGTYPFWACGRVLAWRDLQRPVLSFVDRLVYESDLCDLLGYIRLNRMTCSAKQA